MISSRCNDLFPASGTSSRPLSEIRTELKTELEALTFAGQQLLEVWINEDAPPHEGSSDSWEVCLKAVKECDLLIALSNGNAGWAKAASDIGICHAELLFGLAHAPHKVRLISLGEIVCDDSDSGKRNKRFQEYLTTQSLFRGGEVKTPETLKRRVYQVVFDGVLRLAQAGVRSNGAVKTHAGIALDWSRMNFKERQAKVSEVIKDVLKARDGSTHVSGGVVVPLQTTKVLFDINAIPEAMSVSAAREMVGQPFLRDHLNKAILAKAIAGPVHVIGCHKGVTEAQAIKLLGIPDATVVTTPFGVYVSDNVQKIQLVFVANCRDDSTTRHGLQRFFEWMDQTGEGPLLAKRAQSRSRIVKAIAKEATPPWPKTAKSEA
jgi:hypothetical protein